MVLSSQPAPNRKVIDGMHEEYRRKAETESLDDHREANVGQCVMSPLIGNASRNRKALLLCLAVC